VGFRRLAGDIGLRNDLLRRRASAAEQPMPMLRCK
jgi:hypothetical protein